MNQVFENIQLLMFFTADVTQHPTGLEVGYGSYVLKSLSGTKPGIWEGEGGAILLQQSSSPWGLVIPAPLTSLGLLLGMPTKRLGRVLVNYESLFVKFKRASSPLIYCKRGKPRQSLLSFMIVITGQRGAESKSVHNNNSNAFIPPPSKKNDP